MAIGRISIKSGSKGKGLAHAKYIMREDKYAKRAEKLEKLESVGHGNMPSWAKENPKTFWEMADEHERKNGSVYREHIISLPREMNESQRLELVQDWIKNEIGDKHPYSYAIHNPLAMDGKEQPHCHLMICERTLDGIDRGADQFFKRYNSKDPTKGGAKKANTGLDHATRKEQIKEQRDRWEQLCNKHLERIGSRERVSLKNYKERGVEQPQNISMTDMLKPDVKQAYKDKLHARQELKTALFERIKTVGMTSKALADIEQRQKAQEIKKQSEVTAVTEPLPQTNVKPPNERLERQENKQARIVPPTPPKPLQSENNPPSEPKKLTDRQKWAYDVARVQFAEQIKKQPKLLENIREKILNTPIEQLPSRENPHAQGNSEYHKAVYDHARQLQQKEIATLKAEIKHLTDKKPQPPPPKGLFESKKAHDEKISTYRAELMTHQKTVERKELDLQTKERVSLDTYLRYEHHQAVRQQRPDLAKEYDKAQAWDNQIKQLERDIQQLDKPQEQEQTRTQSKGVER